MTKQKQTKEDRNMILSLFLTITGMALIFPGLLFVSPRPPSTALIVFAIGLSMIISAVIISGAMRE